jgi:hypothetical protein
MRRRRHGRFLALGVAVAAGPILAACDTNDGRDMRPPSSYEEWVLQNTTPSTSTTSTTLPPETLPPTTVAPVVETVVDSIQDTVRGGSDAPDTSGDAAGASLPVDTFAETLGLADLAVDGVSFTGPWAAGGGIPVEHTCTGADTAPLLTWTTPPADTVEVALVVKDESADDFAHWIVIGLPPQAGSVGGSEPLAVGTEATNSADQIGWTGPCPPDAEPHTYRFTLYALSQAIELPPESLPADLIQAIEASASGATSFTGTYQVA